MFFPLKVYALQAGPVLASTCVNETSTGTVTWVNPSNALVFDQVYATMNTGVAGQESNFLTCSGYSPNIPSIAIIDGIQVDVLRYNSASTPLTMTDSTILFTINGTSSTDKELGGSWPNSPSMPTYASYGGPTDNLGLGLTPAQIPNLNFKFSADPSPSKVGSVDGTQLTVFYHMPTTLYSATIRNGTLR